MKKMRRRDRELFEACKGKETKVFMIRCLLAFGANPNARDEYGRTVLYGIEDLDAARILLENGADINNRDMNEETPIYSVNDPEIAELFLSHGASLQINNAYGKTPLHKCPPGLLVLYLEHGADPEAADNNWNRPLHTQHHLSALHILVDAGADINAKNIYGDTPLLTYPRPTDDITKFFIEHGADVSIEDNDGKNALFHAKTGAQVKMLADAGADVNHRDHIGATPLFYVELPEVAEALLNAGADPLIKDYNQNTCLRLCRGTLLNRIRIAKLLINAGADPDKLPKYLQQDADIEEFLFYKVLELHYAGRLKGFAPKRYCKYSASETIALINLVPASERREIFRRVAKEIGPYRDLLRRIFHDPVTA